MSSDRTDAQREASRNNGRKSHGPVSDEGKARSSMNGIKHGLRSTRIVLANESEERFQAFCQALHREWNPAGETEMIWLNALAGAAWRLRRVLDMEAAAIDTEMFLLKEDFDRSFQPVDAPMRQADAVAQLAATNPKLLDVLDRAESRLMRCIERAQRNLILLQTQRLGHAPVLNVEQILNFIPGEQNETTEPDPMPKMPPATYENPERFAHFTHFTPNRNRPNPFREFWSDPGQEEYGERLA